MKTANELRLAIDALADKVTYLDKGTIEISSLNKDLPSIAFKNPTEVRRFTVNEFVQAVWLDEHTIEHLLDRGYWYAVGLAGLLKTKTSFKELFWRRTPELELQQDFNTQRWRANLYMRLLFVNALEGGTR